MVYLQHYDTHHSPTAAASMVSYITKTIPNDTMVLVGNWDSSADKCTTACHNSLRSLGGNTTIGLRGRLTTSNTLTPLYATIFTLFYRQKNLHQDMEVSKYILPTPHLRRQGSSFAQQSLGRMCVKNWY